MESRKGVNLISSPEALTSSFSDPFTVSEGKSMSTDLVHVPLPDRSAIEAILLALGTPSGC